MRKWMRDRLQRRKKKDPEPAGTAAPPPLQPAYFEAEASSAPAPEATREPGPPAASEMESAPPSRKPSVTEPSEQPEDMPVQDGSPGQRDPLIAAVALVVG